MFRNLTLRGAEGSVLWGARTAVLFRSWAITKTPKGWTLRGAPAKVDAYQTRQDNLFFAAPRPQGYWMWPVLKIRVEPNQVVAELGQPEQ